MGNLPLRAKLALLSALLLSVMAMMLAVYFLIAGYTSATSWSERRAEGLATLLAAAVAPSFDLDKADDAAKVLATLQSSTDAHYAQVRLADGTLFASWNPRQVPALATTDSERLRFVYDQVGLHVVAPLLRPGTSGERLTHLLSGQTAVLVLGFSTEGIEAERRSDLIVAILISLLVIALGVALSVIFGTRLVQPISTLTRVAGELVRSGDLTRPVPVSSRDETGQLAISFGQLVDHLRTLLLGVKQEAGGLADGAQRLTRVGATVTGGARSIQGRVGESSRALEGLVTALAAVGDNVRTLQQAAERGAATISSMGQTNDQVAANVASMAASVLGTSESVERMTTAVQEIARHIEDLNASITETSASASEIESSIESIEEAASKTASLTKQAMDQAMAGASSLEKTREGLKRIRQSWEGAGGAMKQLGKRIDQIGDVLNVIEDITNQTNLLALNASIIASQAGEHGRGFSVVANEIRGLADRTRSSTGEIAAMIAAIQKDSRAVTDAMTQGLDNADRGVKLGVETEGVLKSIVQANDQATIWGQHIASATLEQTRGIRQIASAMQRLATMGERINSASTQQAQGAHQVSEAIQDIRRLTQQVQISSQEQARSSRQIVAAIEDIRAMVQHVAEAQQAQGATSRQVISAMGEIDTVAKGQARSVEELEATIGMLREQSARLGAEVAKFKA